MDSTGRFLGTWIREESIRDVWEEENIFRRIEVGERKTSRIEFVFVSQGVVVERKAVVDVGFSDHRMVRVNIGIRGNGQKGKGVWKLNTTLLTDDKACKEFVAVYKGWTTIKRFFRTRWEGWVVIKQTRIQEWFQALGKKKARERTQELTKRQGKVQVLLKQAAQGKAVNEELMEAKRKVEVWFQKRTQERVILAKAP